MRTGISYPSYTGAAYALTTGSAVAGFPVQNLDDKQSIRKVFKATAGAVSLTYTLAAASAVQFIGIMHHNAEVGATYRHRLKDGGGSTIYDSGTLPFYPSPTAPQTTFLASVPHVLAAHTAVSGILDLSAHSTGWQIGGLEVAGWLDWFDVSVSRSFGLVNNDAVVPGVDGADHAMGQFKPRSISGARETLDATTEEDTLLRFMRATGLRNPFVWVWDFDDPTTWARETILVRNTALPPWVRREWPAGDFQFNFVEHLR